MNITRVGVDIAKNVFHEHAVDRHEQCQWQAKLKRAEWLAALGERVPPGATIAMEACVSSHHWSREPQRQDYLVRLIGAQFVKPYVKSHKNDRVDAEAICEAAGRPSMRFVAVKSTEQQDLQAIHRLRSELIKQRVPRRRTRSAASSASAGWSRRSASRRCVQRYRAGSRRSITA